MTTDRLIRTAQAAGVARLTLDSPGNRNALSRALMEQLLAALAAAIADDTVRVVVLSHTGPAFCSGVDLRETEAARAAGELPAGRLGEVLAAVWECPKPVLARVGGPARAGGVGLVAAADLAVCAEDTTFAVTEVRLGVVPAVISATVLPRLSPRAAAEVYLTGAPFDGRRAAAIGLVTAAVPAADLDATVESYVAALVRGAPGALASTKELLRAGHAPRPPAGRDSFRDTVAALTEVSLRTFGSAEGVEGVRAYREKRPPCWVPNGS